MDLISLFSSPLGGGNASPGVGNVGDGGTGKSSAVAKTTFGDKTLSADFLSDAPAAQNNGLLIALAALAVGLLAFLAFKH